MKKTITVILILLFAGCASIERLLVREAKKPEENIISGLFGGVEFSELDFTSVLQSQADPSKVQIDAFFADGNLLYFALSSHLDSEHPDASISTGIFTYDFTSKAFKTVLMIDPNKKFFVTSIAVLKGIIYFSGGYPISAKAGEFAYEISAIKANKAVVLLKQTTYAIQMIPKLLKFDDLSLVFLQTHYEQMSETEFTSGHRITRIREDSSMRSSTEYTGTTNATTSDAALPLVNTFTLDGISIAYAVNKNSESLIYSATYDPVVQRFRSLPLIKVGKDLSPQTLLGFANHWYLTSIKNSDPSDFIMHVFDQTIGNKVATQIFGNASKGFGLASFDLTRGLFFGDFEKGNKSGPNGIGHLFLGHFAINTVKYQRIEKFSYTGWPISFVKLAEKKYLIKGKIDPKADESKYLILQIK